jgi:hypothetical protein
LLNASTGVRPYCCMERLHGAISADASRRCNNPLASLRSETGSGRQYLRCMCCGVSQCAAYVYTINSHTFTGFSKTRFSVYLLGWCISSCGFLNNLFFTQIINHSIMYSPPLFTTASQRSGTFSIPRLKKSAGLAVKKSSQFWSSASLLKKTQRRLLERERKRW